MTSFARPFCALVNGASRGIGRALALQLLASPSVRRVFVTSRRAARDGSLAQIARDGDHRLHAVDMDVTDEASISAACTAVQSATDELGLIVNCAGVLHEGPGMQPEKRLADVSPENLARSFAVNAIGPLLVAKHFQALLPREHRAVFASISARVGSIGDNRLGGWYGYRASKAAQNMITKNLSIELRRRARGTICIALHPGTVDTALSRPFQGGVPDGKLLSTERAARHLLAVIDALQPEDNGGFFAWDGQRIPW